MFTPDIRKQPQTNHFKGQYETEASILGGSRPPPPMKILGGGQTYRFAPPPNNFDNLKNLYVMQE